MVKLIIGMMLGIFVMAMAAAAANTDNRMEEIMQKSKGDYEDLIIEQ